MPTKVSNRGESPRHDVVFDNGANILVFVARPDEIHGRDPAIVGSLQQFLRRLVRFGVRGEKHFGTVAVVAIQVAGNVQINKVPFLERAIVGDAMADDFVDRCAAGFWETVVVQGRWICSSLSNDEGL